MRNTWTKTLLSNTLCKAVDTNFGNEIQVILENHVKKSISKYFVWFSFCTLPYSEREKCQSLQYEYYSNQRKSEIATFTVVINKRLQQNCLFNCVHDMEFIILLFMCLYLNVIEVIGHLGQIIFTCTCPSFSTSIYIIG